MGCTHRKGKIYHRDQGGPTFDADGLEPEKPVRQVTEKLTVEKTEEYRIKGRDQQYSGPIMNYAFVPGPFKGDETQDQEKQAISPISENHTEKYGEKYPDKGRWIIGSVSRQGEEPSEKFERPEIGRVLQNDRHSLDVLFEHLSFFQRHFSPEGID